MDENPSSSISSASSQQKERKIGDCFECKVTVAGGSFLIGSYLLYDSFNKSVKSPFFMRAIASCAFYIFAARVFYLPPFASLRNLKKISERSY